MVGIAVVYVGGIAVQGIQMDQGCIRVIQQDYSQVRVYMEGSFVQIHYASQSMLVLLSVSQEEQAQRERQLEMGH